MKAYTTPIIELFIFESEDVITASYGTSNDNNYSDIGDWF